jgi:hypothetical protein
MADAYARGDRGFLLGNGTGTGKTFVALGAVKQLGTPRTLIVVPNQAIAQQWQDAARESFGLELKVGSPPADAEGVYITTYAQLRKDGFRGQFGLTIYDEVHREATKLRERGTTALLIADLSDASRFAIYSTATPYEPPQQLMYLGPLGLWPHRKGAFKDWGAAHGVRWDVETVRTPAGWKEVSKPKFVGTSAGKITDMLRVRAEIIGAGKGVARELVVDQPLTATFRSLPVQTGPFGERVTRALTAVDHMAINEAHKTNLRKRLLDYPKLDAAVAEAAEQAAAGKRIAVFVSNKLGFDFARGLTDEELTEGGGDVSATKHEMARGFSAAGLTGVLPSPTRYLTEQLAERLGQDHVAEYSGDVTDAKRAKVKAAFQSGTLQAIVATIAAGGTGLSLHDTVGDAPRHQINVGLPWTGKDFSQLVGRTYRLGTKSPVTHSYLVTDHPAEKRLAGTVGGRLATLRAGVSGVVQDTNAASLLAWSMGMDDASSPLAKCGLPLLFRARRPLRLLLKAVVRRTSGRAPDNALALGMTRYRHAIYASGAETAAYAVDDHVDAADVHARIAAYHAGKHALHRHAADGDDDWTRSETHHDEAERHAALAEHHHTLVRDHLIAAGRGGSTTLVAGEDGQPVLSPVVAATAAEHDAAQTRLRSRTHASHPGRLSPRDRLAYLHVARKEYAG